MKKEQKARLHQLYIELVKLQNHIISSDQKLIILLEGRDTAGKDGAIKRITKHLRPRETHIVALGKPDTKEQSQWYFQRYIAHLPARGDIAIFNRSWYNRAGVEYVMGFCTEEENQRFYSEVGLFENMLHQANFKVLKYYLDISKEEQESRLNARRENPLKQWKISPIDDKAQELWQSYSDARNRMLEKTNFEFCPWYIAKANNKIELHLALIQHILQSVDYVGKNAEILTSKSEINSCVDENSLKSIVYQ